jgi:phosphoribosylaminoimidazole-succinocarboxamide synthase
VILASGLQKDQALPCPIITPSTKEAVGTHDEPIAAEAIVSRGLVSKQIWSQVEQVALALFRRGQAICAERGLILVDTKYEFGIVEDRLVLVDEIHTPDSSRFWYANSYQELFEQGAEQRKLDKEYLRTWLLEQGWSGNGTPPTIPEEIFMELGWRYVQAFQEICGENFERLAPGPEAEAAAILSIL